jgi:hypothetical protein
VKRDIRTETTEMQMIREYFENLYFKELKVWKKWINL